MAVMTRTEGSDYVKTYHKRKALEFAKPKLIYPKYGVQDMVPKREGDTVQWLRFDKLSIPASVLSDNPTFSPETITDSTVTAQLQMWGNGVEEVEFLEATSFMDLPKEYKKLVVQNAGETINQKVRDVIKVGTNVVYPNSRASRSALISTDYADLDVFIDAATVLENNDAPTLNGYYHALISPYVKSRLLKNSDFRDAVQMQKDSMFTGVLCTIDNIAFHATSTAPTVSNAGSASSVSTVDQTIIVGEGAYGVSKLLPNNFQVVVTPPGGHGDEYKVKTAITWKAYFKAVILDQSRMIRVETAR